MTTEALICTHPFEWCEIHPDGKVFSCCPAWLKTPIGNLLEQPLMEIWNGPVARGLRSNVLNGTFHSCNRKRCPRLATLAAPVMPIAAVADKEVGEALRKNRSTLPYGPKTVNLCFDLSCNLACPSCRSEVAVASGAAKERAQTLAARLVEQAPPHAERLIVSGFGDPFGSPSYRSLLQGITPDSWPKLRRVDLHTNGQLWDEPTWNRFPGLHPLVRSAEISVDAASAATYAKNRGGDFDRLLANLDFIRTLPIELKLSCVVQHNNFRELPAFVERARRYGASVYLSQLVNWGTFSRGEFLRRAVHLPTHPDHDTLLAVLGPLSNLPHVDLGNLAPLV
ncbi:SPASM domain-containing protein [Trichloromonas sp.]|uniref:SPASM domain-containing protein n=1 Tax=Trichloromonas sp. TaxID=3069249 RepID=UPI003D81BE0B